MSSWLQFLSMKLSAASAYYDLNSLDIEPTDIFQVIITYDMIKLYIKMILWTFIYNNWGDREGIRIMQKRWKGF